MKGGMGTAAVTGSSHSDIYRGYKEIYWILAINTLNFVINVGGYQKNVRTIFGTDFRSKRPLNQGFRGSSASHQIEHEISVLWMRFRRVSTSPGLFSEQFCEP